MIKAPPKNVGVQFLLLCGFIHSGYCLVLNESNEDLELLRYAKTTLENLQQNPTYIAEKGHDQFHEMF